MTPEVKSAADSLRNTVPMLVKAGVRNVKTTNPDTLQAMLLVVDQFLAEHPTTEGVVERFYSDVVGCARCGVTHQHLLFEPLTNPPGPYTHFGKCPATDEPILMIVERIGR